MSKISVVPVGQKRCRPFILEVFVASPEAGYKFELIVEKSCTSSNDALWKLVFDLYKKTRAASSSRSCTSHSSRPNRTSSAA